MFLLSKGRSVSLNMTSYEGTSSNKVPLFDGTNFSFWKVRMRTYIISLGVDVWDVVDTGYVKPVVLASRDDKLEFSFNAKAINIILSGLAKVEFVKVMHLESMKEMWDKILVYMSVVWNPLLFHFLHSYLKFYPTSLS